MKKKFKYISFILFTFLLVGCQDVKKGFSGKNLDKGDQFTDLSHVVEDVISALINLGYGRSDAFSVVMKIKKEFSENKKNDQFTVSYIIPLALKELSR